MRGTRARPATAARPLEEYRRKRDFGRTPEPPGGGTGGTGGLAFVVQKHAARHLHYDLRLELGGVMKSWAVPRGPSLDPSVRRLAVEVEDHPVEYNRFEGTIPAGEYGGGTVLLWDRGTYAPAAHEEGEGPEAALRRGFRGGRVVFTLHGERLRGTFTLVRTSRAQTGRKSQWLLIKQDDEHAEGGTEVTERRKTSVASGRTLEEIEAGAEPQTLRTPAPAKRRGARAAVRTEAAPLPAFRPMLATAAQRVPEGEDWTFEPKYDGIRVLAYATPESAALVTRNGNDKAAQFPELADALRRLSGDRAHPIVLDGEIVAVHEGAIARFERLQGRMHVGDAARARRLADREPAAFVAFDLLLDGEVVRLDEPWTERRAALERLLPGDDVPLLYLGESSRDGARMRERASRAGWEGLIAKRVTHRYRPGTRTRDWLKLKLESRQEFVVGGWTEPRQSRKHLGALLLGYYDDRGRFVYAGHTGTGFSRESLAAMYRRLRRIERKTSPFDEAPTTNAPAHWVTPRLVVEIRFNEWTRDGKLRQPVFVGVRDDRDARSVVRESASVEAKGTGRAGPVDVGGPDPVAHRIRTLAAGAERGGQLPVGPGRSLALTNLDKLFFPGRSLTKGHLLEYYARMAPLILPRMADRPLVLRRYPNGVDGKSFYQQSAPEDAPAEVRIEVLRPDASDEPQRRLVGGDLATLLYTIQLGAISYDPWHSRVQALHAADYAILDLDPGPGATFRTVVEVARVVRAEMDALNLHGALKTSGSRGLHIYLPLPPGTPVDAATLGAQIVATRVAARHPRIATVERLRKRRPRGTVYVDYLQNILGKTVAGVYAARARPEATVSTPIRWEELTDDLDPGAFTIESVPARVARSGDPWSAAMSRPNDLRTLLPGGDR